MSRDVLEERALALAQPPAPPPPPTVPMLRLATPAGDWLAPSVAAEAVTDVVEVTRLPGLAGPWVGVVHLRGALTPVLDLSLLAGAAPTGVRGHVVVLRGDGAELGLLVTDPPSMVGLADADRTPTPTTSGLPDGVVTAADSGGAAVLDPDALVRSLRSPTPTEGYR